MLYNLVSIRRVIAKIFTDLDLKEGEHRITDMISWAGEALLKIGAFPSFVHRITGKGGVPLLNVSGYQAKLPGDLYSIIQVSYGVNEAGPFYPMRYATGSFEYERELTSEMTDSTEVDNTLPTTDLVNLAMTLYNESYVDALARINNYPATRSLLESLLSSGGSISGGDTVFTSDYTYVVSGGWIKLSQETGYLMVTYQAIPVDKDGYPLVPDDESFLEALYWYINMKLMYPEWKEGRIRDAVYYDARRSWNYYCKQSYGNAMMPNSDQLESIKNTWLRLIPAIDEHETFYSTMGEREIIYKQ
jgi:hypothetical protein